MNKTTNVLDLNRFLRGPLLLVICLCAGDGCQTSDKSVTASFASVTITGSTPRQIRNVAVQVFDDNGYKVAEREPTHMVFEKEGTRMNNLAYGTWLNDKPVYVRVKASVVSAGEKTYCLQCTAYMVQDIGTGTEEEIAVSYLHRKTYQKLLDDVAKRLTPN
jgi:hypothetical protein